MPNGESKNWIRFLGSLEGFRQAHGHWPMRAYVPPFFIDELRRKMKPGDFELLQAKLDLVPDHDATFRAEDADGLSYDYGEQGFPETKPDPRGIDWLEVSWPDYYD